MAVAATLLCSACHADDETPDGAVRQLLEATARADAARAYELLAPKTRKRLQKLAELATAQTGGRRRIEPHDLLAVAIAPPRHDMARVEVTSQQGDQATVRVSDAKGKASETMHLVRVKNRWRVELPANTFQQPD